MPVEDPVVAELPWLRRLARRLASQEVDGDADDLVQDAWLMAHRDKPEARGRSGLRPWLAQAMRNRLRSRQRASISRKRREGAVSPAPSEGAAAETKVMEADVLRILDDALDTLSDEQRTLLRERFFSGRTAAEIASELGVPSATVRTRIRRSLLQLREVLDEHHGNDRAQWVSAVVAVPLTGSVRGGVTVASTKGIVIGGGVAAAALLGWFLIAADGDDGAAHAASAGSTEQADSRALGHHDAVGPPTSSARRESVAGRDAADLSRRASESRHADAAERLAEIAGRAGAPEPTPTPALTPAEIRDCAVNAAKHDCDFLEPGPMVIEDMAACGIVRYDFPAMFAQRDWTPEMAEEWLDLVGARGPERDAIAEVADAVREELYGELEALATEVGEGPWETDKTLFDAVIELSQAVGDDSVAEASRLVAQERAGRAEPPGDVEGRAAAERFVRAFTAVGDRLETALGERLGEARAHELHLAQDGWPGLRAQTGARCPE